VLEICHCASTQSGAPRSGAGGAAGGAGQRAGASVLAAMGATWQ
jgi:hypothetical protein